MKFIGCLLVLLLTFGCGGDGNGDGGDSPPGGAPAADTVRQQPASHKRMVKALQGVVESTTAENSYLGDRMYRTLSRHLAEEPGDTSETVRVQRRVALAREALRLGKEQEAIDLLLAAYKMQPSPDIAFALGVAHMRLAETQNCCLQHNSQSCIVPFGPQAIHTQRDGAEQAIRWFTDVLAAPAVDQDTQLAATWLLNIAHMTLGDFPAGVPAEHRLPESAFASDTPFPKFANVAPSLGLATFGLAGGVVVDDFDNDDDLDILTSSWQADAPMHYFRNNGDGTFTDRTDAANLAGIVGGLNMVQADYDNDGDVDVLVLRGAWLSGEHGKQPNSLLQNQGGGVFIDVTFDAGLGEAHHPTQVAGWADYDNDGHVDLYIGNENAPSQLFRNNGDGTFTDVAEQAGVTNDQFPKGVTWGDIDGDNDADLCVSNYRGVNRLYRNNGDGTFTDIAADAGVTQPRESFPCWFWDADNDGRLDLFIASYNGTSARLAAHHLNRPEAFELPGLYRGDGAGRFTQTAAQAGLTAPIYPMGSNFGDLDGDGYLDFYLGTGDPDYANIVPSRMYLNVGGERFADVTMAGGFGHLQKGHGIAFADLDHDGDLDVFAQMGGAYPGDPFYDALYENPGFAGRRWLTVQLVGVRSNRSAIGARIHVEVRDASGKSRSIYRHVNSGGSFGANPLRQTIGLGEAARIEKLSVLWPTTGKTQVFENVKMNPMIRIKEGESAFERIDVKPFRLGGK